MGGCVGGLLGKENERMVAACEGRQEGIEVWDVCTWGFRCLRGTGSGGYGRFRDHQGGYGDGREGIWSVSQICAVVS